MFFVNQYVKSYDFWCKLWIASLKKIRKTKRLQFFVVGNVIYFKAYNAFVHFSNLYVLHFLKLHETYEFPSNHIVILNSLTIYHPRPD